MALKVKAVERLLKTICPAIDFNLGQFSLRAAPSSKLNSKH